MDASDPPVSNYPRRSDPPPQDRASQLAATYVSIEHNHRFFVLMTILIYFMTGIVIYAQLSSAGPGFIAVPFIILFGALLNLETSKKLVALLCRDRQEQKRFRTRQAIADFCFLRRRAMRPIMQQLREEIGILNEEDVETVLERERLRLRKLPTILP